MRLAAIITPSLLLLTTGCFAPDLNSTLFPCTSHTDCLSGQACVESVCRPLAENNSSSDETKDLPPGDITQDQTQDTPNDTASTDETRDTTPTDMSRDQPDDLTRDMPTDTPTNTSNDSSKDMPDDTSGDMQQCVPETTQETCIRLGKECSTLETVDNCGNKVQIDCGTCGMDETCQVSSNTCVCNAVMCGTNDCGTRTNACGNSATCGTCGMHETCTNNQCVCDTISCPMDSCGTISNACGNSMNCGGCGTDEMCSNNQCVCPPVSCSLTQTCGDISNACGSSTNCGSCPGMKVCIQNTCSDPVFTPPAMLTGDIKFGHAVAWYDANTLLIGAPYADINTNTDQGIVYVYTKDANGAWSQTGTINAPTSAESDQLFGWSIDTDGTSVIIGATHKDAQSATNSGIAYVFLKSGNTFTLDGVLSHSTPDNSDMFGWDVAVDGDYAIVGAPFDDDDGDMDIGTVHLYRRENGMWSPDHNTSGKLNRPSDKGTNRLFGFSVDIRDTSPLPIAIIGSPANMNDPNSDFVYRIERSSFRNWNNATNSPHNGAFQWSQLGTSVSFMENDNFFAGAPGINLTGMNRGAIILYHPPRGNWQTETRRQPAGVMNNTQFGKNIAAHGSFVAVQDGQDTVYAGNLTTSNFTTLSTYTKASSNFGDALSVLVDGNNKLLAVGAPTENTSRGAVYIYTIQ